MILKLAATKLKQAKPKDKAYKMTDGKGLYLLVHPQNGKYWRYVYSFTDKKNISTWLTSFVLNKIC